VVWFDLVFSTEKLAKCIDFLMGFFMVFYEIDFFKIKNKIYKEDMNLTEQYI
jgi:hypothetical protein